MNLEDVSIVEALAILSASAAGGLRVGLPLLIVLLVRLERRDISIVSSLHFQVIVGILISWSLFELVGNKKLVGFRAIQIVQLLTSPLVGGFLAVTVARLLAVSLSPVWLLGLVGGLLALVLKLVQVGWFFRLGRIPLVVIFIEDLLSVLLIIFSLKAPKHGGLIALLLLWIALRSSTEWRHQYLRGRKKNTHNPPHPNCG
ncbi:MAG: DUF4126 domain-containing protein [Geminocystis sp.]|nr:DUF4126 domain-containing protein [Geminocystis sp.]HIK37096.1 DUF4126 domain-containing protein [Geminocystis sp. M7585_C2015_104]MCS7148620.1 DUF4126 domain-containing protein [Geminocystis sp.]MCX8079394.1 DUF4126 domain-containing protein [Geminocystis sp.]MDW8114988.1 DUF4126 domain-containing protein [Geminocystis sp.]